MTSARDSTSRLRQTLNPLLTTSLGGFHGQLSTPHSAISVSSPYAYSSSQTPASSVQPYNPQEWAPSPVVERRHQFPPAPSQEPQSSPLPPPPYSPPRSQGPVSGSFETPPANTSATRIPPTGVHRPSPEPQCAQNFPPPPAAGGRGASRERRFGLPSLSRRRDRDSLESNSPPEAIPPAPIMRPQPLTIQVPQLSERIEPTQPIAPAARRAASASAVETPTSARSRSSSQSRWAPGMPLPPPPPGPPPSNSRSQSLNRTIDPNPVLSPPTRRPPPNGVTALGPVPPTPADWIDDDRQQANRAAQAGLIIDTAGASSVNSQPEESATSGSSSAGGQLSRAGAVRGEKSLRERRNESRTRHSRGESSTNIPPLTDILVPQGAANLSRRFSVHRGTPRSGGRSAQDTPWSGDLNGDSRNSTPRVESAGIQHPETPTPPFSPRPQRAYPGADNGQPLAPKALPTPPPQSRSASSSSFKHPELHNSISSLIHGAPPSTPMTKQGVISQTADQFCKGTIERFQAFARKEASAASDADRVKLFADFIVNESRLRRERYNSAIGAMGSEIFDLTRDLFRPMKTRRDSESSQASEWTPQVSATHPRSSAVSLSGRDLNSQPNSAPTSAGVPISPVGGPPQVAWNSNYKPALSPILSMSVSDAFDEADSRGRPSSRWWEGESTGESSQRLERSKRESKYMGVPKEAREALQWRDPPNSAEAYASSSKGYGPDEYPPEKVGWHEPEQSNTPQPPSRRSLLSLPASTPNTPSPSLVDVSRLVTLPPPYPRHHPAVNNNHPELTEIRGIVRTLSDLKELADSKERFSQESKNMRAEAAEAAKERRQNLRTNLQREISSGQMSYADAAAIEADGAESEQSQAKELEKKDFDRFQNAVVMPSNEMLTGRIGQATSLFDELRSRLFVDTHTDNPNLPQEEGDEQPELLEKLTLLKWIFEAREMLHREIFDLLSDRNDRYKEMVIMPYRRSGNDEKLRNAEAFFAEDAEKRRVAFANEVLQRTIEFRGVVEENVERGIDMQLNAFWDIAPPLKSLLDKVPATLRDFRIQIPPHEFEENPSYHQHPMQYLFSLLLHTEKSTYQFIESQTNLLCLLHEVKEAVMGAKGKLSEAQGRDASDIEKERNDGQKQLTDDLQEKVRVVQGQWNEGLGEGIRLVKERVGEWLLSTGGWDETLEDLGIAA